MPSKSTTIEIVLPDEACRVLGYTRAEMVVLIEHRVVSHLIHWNGCNAYYLQSELTAFRSAVGADEEFALCIDDLLGRSG